MKRKWNANGTQMEEGTQMERKWNPNGTQMERKQQKIPNSFQVNGRSWSF